MKAQVIYKDAVKQARLEMMARTNALQYASRGGQHSAYEYISSFYGNRVLATPIR